MLLDAQLDRGLIGAADAARLAEQVGFAGVWAAEVVADPALAIAAATTTTSRVTLGTNVILAFTRNPMSVAMQAWELQRASRGRFVLGLATQVKPHITRRFSMPWEAPVARMREFVQALRHIMETFQGEHPLDFRGRFYSHTLLHPMFAPGPIDHPRIPIGLGGVGPQLTALAGELGDLYLLHAFTNLAYQDKVTLPALERGLAAAGRRRADVSVFGYLMLIAGDTEDEQTAGRGPDPLPDRVLRVQPDVPRGARRDRMCRSAGAISKPSSSRAAGTSCRASSTTTCSATSRCAAPSRSCPRSSGRATAATTTGPSRTCRSARPTRTACPSSARR